MLIGMMNYPGTSLKEEITFAAKNGFDYLDLTMEPPKARHFDVGEIRNLLKNLQLRAVGHTAYYLTPDSPFQRIRKANQEEIIAQLRLFQQLDIRKVTLHFAFSFPQRFFSLKARKQMWTTTLIPLLEECRNCDIQLMLENTQNSWDTLRLLVELIETFPELGFNLDVAHANLHCETNKTEWLLENLATHLAHVHLSDNMGGDDLHLPLGCGYIPWKRIIRKIKSVGYDGTCTLEVFSKNRNYLIRNRKLLRSLWGDA